MRVPKVGTMRGAAVWAVLAGLAAGTAGLSGCGSGGDGSAPAQTAPDVVKKSMEATGSYYQQQHAKKKK